MGTFVGNWEDEENNRIVQLSVEYRIDDNQIEIESVTPTSILFIDAETHAPVRRMNVWTEGGRRVLARQIAAKQGVEHVRLQIESQLAQTAR